MAKLSNYKLPLACALLAFLAVSGCSILGLPSNDEGSDSSTATEDSSDDTGELASTGTINVTLTGAASAEGDYFYVLTRGSALVTRETPLSKDGIKLAELRVGDTFGEEALISDAKRNATVTMLTDGGVMRLGKEDFKKLLNEPMLDWVTLAQAEDIIRTGGQWLDVRLPSEFENQHLDGALNIPLYFIRLKISTLDKSKKYVVCCDTGRRSSAGAYILSERGYNAYVLKGGINAENA